MEFLLSNLIHQIEAIYPLGLAEEWDPVGLHFGNLNSTVSRIMTTLDVTESVVEEAISQNVDTIVAHHPLIFSSIKRLDLSLIHISEPTRQCCTSRMPSSA